MKSVSLILSALCLFFSCSTLPKVRPVNGSAAADLQQECRGPFPVGKWQFLHTIQATMPGGEKALMLGVTVISSHEKTARCVIMTIEGLVVFDALYDQHIVINRGIPPFDSKEFAKGLIGDIKLIFFMPEGPLIESGVQEDGLSICRHQGPEGSTVDIISHADKSWEIRQYDKHFDLSRRVRAFLRRDGGDTDSTGMPKRVELRAQGVPGYSLALDLVEAVPLGR